MGVTLESVHHMEWAVSIPFCLPDIQQVTTDQIHTHTHTHTHNHTYFPRTNTDFLEIAQSKFILQKKKFFLSVT